jgi:hypothetical protein
MEPKWWRDPYRAGGAILTVIGLAGIPDDLKKWGSVVSAIAKMLDHELARWVFVIGGLGLFFAAQRLPHFKSRRGVLLSGDARDLPKDNGTLNSELIRVPQFNPATIGDLMVHRQMVRAGKTSSPDPADMIPPMKCPLCEGNGRRWGRYEAICNKCGGTGELPGELLTFPKCRVCGGNGRKYGRYEEQCGMCYGLGVRIPDQRGVGATRR